MAEAAGSAPLPILGGTFDPIHYGHLRCADEVRRALEVPEARLIPAGTPPHRTPPRASAEDRFRMTELGAAEFGGLVADRHEIDQSGKSYTVRTLELLREEAPRRPLALIVGADALVGLPTWHRWIELFDLAHIIVVARPGMSDEAVLPPRLQREWDARITTDPHRLRTRVAGAIYRQQVTPQPISATEIRAALASGRAGLTLARRWLPAAVLAYIQSRKLYGCH